MFDLYFFKLASQRATILAGMQMIVNRTAVNGKSCISFKQRTTETNYVSVFSGVGCYSYVNKSSF
jgi:hypothetical protein